MEYAANGTRYWPVEQLRALFETSCAARDIDPELVLRDALQHDRLGGRRFDVVFAVRVREFTPELASPCWKPGGRALAFMDSPR